jgi:hypothetical protein
MIEGAAGAVVAACVNQGNYFAGQNMTVVICGANISVKTLKAIL